MAAHRGSRSFVASCAAFVVALSGVQALQVVAALPAHAAVAVTVATPTTLHGNGAELSWSRFVPDAGVAFGAYEVHRSATAAFTPSAATRLTTIRDLTTTRWTDTTAKPATAFSYRVVADGTVSNEIRVTLPGAGLATKTLQPSGSTGDATYVARDTTTPAACYDDYNYGAHGNLRIGTALNGVQHRPMLRFDLRDVPVGAKVSAASLTLTYAATTATGMQVNVHRLRQPWREGTGTGQCNGSGATWNSTENGIRWKTGGGTYVATAATSIAAKARGTAGTDTYAVTTLVQEWVNGTPNHGMLLKLADETIPTSGERYFNYYSDDYATAASRPKLTVTYADGNVSRAPRVSVVAPAGNAPVRGTAVPLTAAAGDDRSVAKVEFLVDAAVVATDTGAPWAATWNSATATAGAHTVTARATDDAGNVTTSSARSVTVDNSAAPTVAVTAPVSGTTVTGLVPVTANALDDVAVSSVEFYADGSLIGTDTTAPYAVTWDTLDPLATAFDGSHTLTATAYDAGGQSGTSSAVTVTVANTAGSSYQATFDLNAAGPSDDPVAVPPTVVANELAPATDPSGGTTSGGGDLKSAPNDGTASYQTSSTSSTSSASLLGTQTTASQPKVVSANAFQADVTVTNTSPVPWRGGDLRLWYRWYTPDGIVLFEGPGNDSFPQTVQPGQSKTIPVTIEPPAAPAGTDLTQVRLRFDVYDTAATTANKWFGGLGNKPVDNPVIVERRLEGALGLERWWQYEGDNAGAGMTTLSNVSNGNMLLRWSPFFAPGRGLATMVDLTYNSLEDHSESPAGNNFSLSISGLTRWGYGLDIHPNKADEITGRSRKYVVLTDGDGTTHEFKGTTDANGVTTWAEPPGVNLYLRSTTDPVRHWALTRPDAVTFWFDTDGYPTAVVDRNGNTLTFQLEDTPPGEDPGGPKRRVVRVLDAAGRAFDVDYWSKAEAKKAHVRGKIQRITDHSGSALDFDYYDDGNLLRLTQRGGTGADGSLLADRSFVFTYTVPAGTGPAIADATARKDPNPRTMSQSTRLYSVADPRGNETTFAYYGPAEGAALRWKLKSRTNRAGKTTTFTYDTTNRRTTVLAPLSRDTEYVYDTLGRVTSIVDPLEQNTNVNWTADNKVSVLGEPSLKQQTFTYNANGYLTSQTDQLGNKTVLTYADSAVDANDTARHLSLLATRTTPRGVATAVAGDYQWSFSYDGAGNVDKTVDPEHYVTDYDWNLAGSAAPGTVAKVTDPNGGVTTFGYDPSGQPSRITDAENQVTQLGYDADGSLVWTQDPNHANDSGTDTRAYRTYFDYDAFHRLGRQSAPKSTATDRGRVVWSGVAFDPNDNVVRQVEPHFGGVADDDAAAPVRTATFDVMDRPTVQADPDTSLDPLGERTLTEYDDAGRVAKTTRPRGAATATVDDFTTVFGYDVDDRLTRKVEYGTSTTDQRVTHLCYDVAGDLRSVTSPRAGLATVTCPATGVAFTATYDYDAAHRRTATRDALGHERRTAYDANGNVVRVERDIASGRMSRVERQYDQRDLPVRSEELFSGASGRELVSLVEYDGNANKVRSISPRAYDAAAGSGLYTAYVTGYTYDRLNRLTRVDLPFDSRDGAERQYVHRWYDGNGNVSASSFPVTTADRTQVADTARTVTTFYDPGWIRTTKTPTDPLVSYDYTAQGWQARRSPDRKGSPGTIDVEREMLWEYFADGTLKTRKDRDGNPSTYTYDEDDNLRKGVDASGVTDADDVPMETDATYTGFDQPDKVRHRKQGATVWTFTDYDYDLGGNVTRRLENGEESASTGAQTKAPRTYQLTYDAADWLSEQLDLGVDGLCKDDQRIVNQFWDTGWEKRREVFRGGATCTADPATWPSKQVTTWDHFDNGKLATLVTKDATGAVTESHDVDYFESGRYENGDRTLDRFVLKRASTKTGVTKCLSATPCTADFDYDARGKVLRHQKREGDVATYALDEPVDLLGDTTIRGGNVTTQVDDGQTQTRKYDSNQLKSVTVGTSTVDYLYDAYGQVDCVVTGGTATTCPASGTSLVTDYAYDDLERLAYQKSYSAGAVTDSADYTYDALDRTTKEVETHNDGGANNRTTAFTFQGLSNLVTEEKQSGGTNPKTKTYSYDAYGHRISMTDKENTTTTPAETFTYGYDVHGSVSQLLSDSGAVKASYGYDAYGGQDAADTATDGLTSGDLNDKAPLNPYRYSARRLDSGSATASKAASSLDMGARRFGVDTGRFIQDDMFGSALGNLGLAVDPLSMNRYALAGGNPVSFVEVDGHMVMPDGGGGGSTTPTPPTDDDGSDNQDAGDYWSLTGWFTNEINTNIKSDTVQNIRAMNDQVNYYLSDEPSWWERIFQPDVGSLQISAMSAWTSKVCQKICDWDHKPKIEDDYGMGEGGKDHWTAIPGTNKEIYYDIWSNIHYGYVGRAAGFDAKTLLDAQNTNLPIVGKGDDPGDDFSVQLGIDLYERYGDEGLPDGALDAAVRESISTWESFDDWRVRDIG